MSPLDLVREHARGKARSVAARAGTDPCSASTPRSPSATTSSASRLTPARPSGCSRRSAAARTPSSRASACSRRAGSSSSDDTTSVTFRELTPRDLAAYVATGEWEGRAGGYAIQGRGAALVERIEGDYLNVVGLPAALLVRTLAERFPGAYGLG